MQDVSIHAAHAVDALDTVDALNAVDAVDAAVDSSRLRTGYFLNVHKVYIIKVLAVFRFWFSLRH